MGPFQRHSIASRYRVSAPRAAAVRSRRGFGRIDGRMAGGEPLALDPEAGQVLRGLIVGLPLGLAIWALFVLMVWRIV